jgi:multidrug efflux pump subunit AcrA (membrane-fusion protein)
MIKFFKRLRVRQSLAFAVSFLLLLVILDELESTTTTDNEQVINKQPLITEVIAAEPVLTMPKLQRLGTVVPVILSQINTHISGKVIKVSAAFKKGRLIKEGQSLLTIDPLPYQVALVDAKTSVLEAELTLQNTKISFSSDSLKVLLAQSRLKSAKMNLNQAQNQLKETEIRLPYTGEITEIETYLGEYMSVGDSVAKVLPQQDKQIKVLISEQDFVRLSLPTSGQVIEIVSLDKIQKWSAKIIGISQHTENLQRTLYLSIPIYNEKNENAGVNGPLYGQHIYVQLPLKIWQSTYSLPESSLTLKGEIWWINSSNKLIKMPLNDYVLASNKVYFQLPDLNLTNAVLFPSAALTQGMQVSASQFTSQ